MAENVLNFSENKVEEINNSLCDMNAAIMTPGFGQLGYGTQVSSQETLMINTSWAMISNNRTLLSQAYVQYGIIQTLCDQPVDDAFRPGFEIKSEQLDGDDIELLMAYVEMNKVVQQSAQGAKWARLYGGGGVIIVTEEDPSLPFNPLKLKKGSRVAFKSFDMWELYFSLQNEQGEVQLTDDDGDLDSYSGEFYDYYGKNVHRSRVMRIDGKQAPAFVRPRLRGWGMSEVERCIRSLNQYIKNQDVVFELLDEAKVDVYKMKGFNSALMNTSGTAGVANRIQNANMLKNFQNAITMDVNDEYEQKTMNFAGLGDILTQIRQGLAADLKMPMTKLFGISAAGFNSGEDDIENYNAMVESEVRAKIKYHIVEQLKICCQVLFGFYPHDLSIKFKPLRIMGADQEEKIKTDQFNRVTTAFSSGLISGQTANGAINAGSLLPIEIDDTSDPLPPLGSDYESRSAGG